MLLVGVAMWLLPRRLPRCIGLVVAGFGLIFLGIDTMQVMAGPLQQSDTFRALFLESSHSIWLGLLTGTIFTALIHSSSATTAITMGLMSHHILSMETALAIVLGANIGTCFTAVIASFGTNAASRQVAWCHTLFNVLRCSPVFAVSFSACPGQRIFNGQSLDADRSFADDLQCHLLAGCPALYSSNCCVRQVDGP